MADARARLRRGLMKAQAGCRGRRCGDWCAAHGRNIRIGGCSLWTSMRLLDAGMAGCACWGSCCRRRAEPELALRHGAVLAPRLARAGAATGALQAPAAAQDYRVAVTGPGRLDGVSLVAAAELSEPLSPGQIRVGVRRPE